MGRSIRIYFQRTGKKRYNTDKRKFGNTFRLSITELIDMLSKKNLSITDKKRVLDFVAERLRILEQNLNYQNQVIELKKGSKNKKKEKNL